MRARSSAARYEYIRGAAYAARYEAQSAARRSQNALERGYEPREEDMTNGLPPSALKESSGAHMLETFMAQAQRAQDSAQLPAQ